MSQRALPPLPGDYFHGFDLRLWAVFNPAATSLRDTAAFVSVPVCCPSTMWTRVISQLSFWRLSTVLCSYI